MFTHDPIISQNKVTIEKKKKQQKNDHFNFMPGLCSPHKDRSSAIMPPQQGEIQSVRHCIIKKTTTTDPRFSVAVNSACASRMTSLRKLQSQTVNVKEPLRGQHRGARLGRFGGGARFTGGGRTATFATRVRAPRRERVRAGFGSIIRVAV